MESDSRDSYTLSILIEKLRQKGIEHEFKYDNNKFCLENKKYEPQDLKIIKTFRFEGASDPDDNAVLQLIETSDKKLGYTIDAYGAYSNYDGEGYDDFLKKIPMEDRPEQEIFGT